MDRLYDFKLTQRELAEIMAAASKVWEKGVELEALAVVTKIKEKAAALLTYIDAKETEDKTGQEYMAAKRARQMAFKSYGDTVKGGDDIARDTDGIPILPFDSKSQM